MSGLSGFILEIFEIKTERNSHPALINNQEIIEAAVQVFPFHVQQISEATQRFMILQRRKVINPSLYEV